MPIGQDEDIRICELPEAQELVPGMKVAVDSETDGTKSFDLSNLAGKVDEPETEPEAGQVLTFDGTENTWANPPEGVYVLKYSEVTNLDDVDLDKATTIPTFILIDSDQILTIGNSTSSDTISINSGTIMRLEEVGGNDNGKPMFLTFVNDYGKSATGGTYMTYGNYFVRLVVSKSMYGGVSKKFGVSADIWSSGLFRSQQVPVVKKYDNARGPAGSGGSLNGDANSLIVSFEDAGSNKRRQLLPPAELASHDFSNDSTPEQIQFMGWGATSNRAGYKTMLTAKDWIEPNTNPEQTPTLKVNRFINGNSVNYSNDQIGMALQATVKSADGQTDEIWTGNLLTGQFKPGCLQTWDDSNGGRHTDWKPVNEVPASTAQDEGKVLTVDSNGAAAWAASGGGTEKFIIRGLVYPSSATYIDNDKAVVDKTTTEIRAAYESGQELELQFYVINDTAITAADIDSKFAEQKDTLAPYTADLTFAYIPDSQGNIQFGFIFRSPEFYSFNNYFYDGMPSAYEYTRTYSQIRINISRYSGGDSDWISAYSEANDLGNWQIQADYWNDTTVTYGNNWDYFYNTVRYYMKNHNSIELRLDFDGVNTPRCVAYLSDYLFSNNPSYPPFLLFTHLYVPACLQGQAYRTEVRWYKFYPSEEVNPDTGETVKVCKLSYGKINTQPMLPNLYVNNSSGFTISSSPWILPENNTYITPTIDSSLTELVILVSKDTIGFNAASNAQFTMRFSLSGGRTLRVRVGEQHDNGVITYFNYDADKGRDLVSPSGVYSTYFNIKVVGRSWTFEKLAADSSY